MIRTLFLQPLGPALILALGGLSFWAISWLTWRYALARYALARRAVVPGWFRLPLALVIVAAAAGCWLRIAATPAAQNLSWKWQPLTVAGATIHWRLDPWNGVIILILLLVTAVAMLRVFDDDDAADDVSHLPAPGPVERTLWLSAAALTFVCSANLLTVASSWLLLDACVLLRLGPGRQAEPAAVVDATVVDATTAWSLLMLVTPLLLFVLAMLGEAGLPASLVGGRFGRQELGLLWLLGLIRVGVYPFHFWLTAPGGRGVHGRGPHDSRAGSQTIVHLLGPVAGIWFLARIQELAGASLTRRPEWAALGVLALLGSAMAAWLAAQPAWRWRWIAINRASVVLLAAYVAGIPGPAAFAWPLVAFALGSALLTVGRRSQSSARDAGELLRWPAILGALILWGAPGTAGFLAHSALIFPTELALAAPLFAVVLVGEILLVAALWETVRSAGTGTARTVARRGDAAQAGVTPGALLRVSLAIVLLAVPAFVWGLYPQRLAALGGFSLPDGALTLAQLIAAARRSVWIGLILSALGGAALGIWRRAILDQMRGWQQIIGEVVSLDWLYRAVAAGLRLAGSGLQYFATLGEGEGYLGWLALAGLILWVLIRG
jgi:hypothetical protein